MQVKQWCWRAHKIETLFGICVQSTRAVRGLEIDLAKYLRAHVQSPPAFNLNLGCSNLMTSHYSPSKSPSVAFQPYWEGIVSALFSVVWKACPLSNLCRSFLAIWQGWPTWPTFDFHVTRILCNKAAMIGAIMGIPISGLRPNRSLKKVRTLLDKRDYRCLHQSYAYSS